MSGLIDEWTSLLASCGSVMKARRAFIRSRRWTREQWYAAWPEVGTALETALRNRQVST